MPTTAASRRHRPAASSVLMASPSPWSADRSSTRAWRSASGAEAAEAGIDCPRRTVGRAPDRAREGGVGGAARWHARPSRAPEPSRRPPGAALRPGRRHSTTLGWAPVHSPGPETPVGAIREADGDGDDIALARRPAARTPWLPPRSSATVGVILLMVVWGSTFVVTKATVRELPPLTLGAVRFF